MGKINVGRSGKWYTLNGEIVKPKDFWGIGGFKFANHIAAWATGQGEAHLDRAQRYIENEVVGLGCRRMRAPVELLLWSGPYFDLPADGDAPYNIPNLANTQAVVNLNVNTGSGFSLPPLFKRIVRMYVKLAREFDIVIEVPWIWTIKVRATKRTKHYPDPREESNGGKGISAWLEHYMASRGVGGYLELLATKGDGDGNSRVDAGPLNLLHDFCNEYATHTEDQQFSKGQLRSMCRRWRTRDAMSQKVILISQASGRGDTYDPPLQSKVGDEGFSGVCVHPPRDVQKGVDWDETGDLIRGTWLNELIDVNESQLLVTQADREYWFVKIPKWAGLGSTDMVKCERMHENFTENDIYSTLHTMRAMDAYHPETEQGVVEDTVRRITGGTGPPPPPPRVGYRQPINILYRDVLARKLRPGRSAYASEKSLAFKEAKVWKMLAEGVSITDALHAIAEEMYASEEYANKN